MATAAVTKLSSLSQRLIVVIFLIPACVIPIYLGSWPFAILVIGGMGIAAWEYWRMFYRGGYRPSVWLIVAGAMVLCLARFLWSMETSALVLTLAILVIMAVQVFDFANGETTAAVDFNINLGGVLYLGWIGSYLISLRMMPDGFWWFLLVLPITWINDGGAYLVGRSFGRHKMAPHVSPNKSWEGYIGGIVVGIIGATLLAGLWQLRAPTITPMKGFILGAVISIVTPLGDLFESMLKRGFGIKDASNLIPGHGGILDRIDSWLWAAPLGFYLVILMLM
jgi:phosphatidate cytidylyltransferase